MSSSESNKSLAGVGALLLAFGSFVPIVGIVGIILLLIGIKGLSEYYNDRSVYQHALWGVIFGIVGLVAAAVIVIGFIWGSIFGGLAFGAGFGLVALTGVVLAVVVLFVFYLLAAIYFRRAFSTLAQKSGEHMFETAGLLLFIGAILTIILVGLVLVFVAWILVAVAFFSMTIRSQPAAVTAPVAGARYCPNCGSPVALDATFCSHCGRQLS